MQKKLLALIGMLAGLSMLTACSSLFPDGGTSSGTSSESSAAAEVSSSSLIVSSSETSSETSNETSSSSASETSSETSSESASSSSNSASHTHSYAAEWSYDENGHWKACTDENCDEKTQEGVHTGGTATCTVQAVCTECGQKYGALANHEYTVEKHDENNHWKECACGAIDETSVVAHSGGTATCTEQAVCTECGQKYGALGEHTYAETLTKGETTHWYAATCVHSDLKKDETGHSYGDYTVTTEAIGSGVGEKTATCVCGATQTQKYVNTGITGVFGADVNVSATQGKAENQLDGTLKVYSDWWVKVAFDGVQIPENATHIVIKMKANQQLTGDAGDGILFEATGVAQTNIGIVETEYKEFKIALSTNNCPLNTFNLCVQDGTGTEESPNEYKVIYIESISFVVLKESDTPTETTIFGGETPVTVGATQGTAVAMSDGSLKLTGAWWINATFDGAQIPENATKMIIRAKANAALTGVQYGLLSSGTTVASDYETGLSIGTEYQDYEIMLNANNCALTNFNLCVQDDGSGVCKIVYIESITFVVLKESDTPNQTTIFGGETPVTVDATQGTVVAMSDGSLKVYNEWWVNAKLEGVTVPDGATKLVIRLKANTTSLNVKYRFSNNGGDNGTMCFDETTGFTLTTEYQTFTIDISESESLTNFGLCVENKIVYIESITFA